MSDELPKLKPMGAYGILWTAFFYNPKHSGGDRTRLNRLEEQVRIVMRLTSLTKCACQSGSPEHECFRRKDTIEFLTKHNKMLIDAYRDLTEDVNCRIAKMVVKKRFLLHVLFFIYSKEKELAKRYEDDLKKLENVVLDDTNDWMEILDFVETMRNPNYLSL